MLEKSFEPLNTHSPDLASEVVAYLLEGTGGKILDDLAALKDAGEILQLNSARYHDTGAKQQNSLHAQFLRQVDCRDAAFHVRLAEVYEACVRKMRSDFMSPSMFGDLAFEWLDVFLWEASNVPPGSVDHKRAQKCKSVDTDLVEVMLECKEQPADSLVRALLLHEARVKRPGQASQGVWWADGYLKPNIAFLPGIARSFARHKAPVVAALQDKPKGARAHAVQVLDKLDVKLENFASELVELATATSKQTRQSMALLMSKLGEGAVPALKEKAANGSKDERLHAVQWLRELAGDDCRDFFAERLEKEKSAEIVAILREAADSKKAAPAKPAAPPAQKPLSATEMGAALSDETRLAFQKAFASVNDILRARKLGKPVKETVIDEIFENLQTLEFGKGKKPRVAVELPEYEDRPWRPLKEFLTRPELKLVHAVRLLYLTGQIHPDHDYDAYFLGDEADSVLSAFRKTHRFDLGELAAVMSAIGLDGDRLGVWRLGASPDLPAPFSRWEADAVWPYFSTRLEHIDAALRSTNYDAKDRHRAALGVLALFPQPPAKYLPMLWEKALGSKAERVLAQPCLERVPDRMEKLLAALKSGKANLRAAAAEWLGRIRDPAAVEPILAALKAEKQEVVRDAFMLALEQLGVPADRFLDRDGLKAAAKDVAKLWPKDLKWFPLAQLPRVHWEDSGKPIEPEIIQLWLLNTWKVKNPEPTTLLRRYCSSIKTAEREKLGQFILDAWMAEDLIPISRAEAEKEARAYAKAMVNWGSYAGAGKTTAEADYYARSLADALKKPCGSAVAHKGILAVAAACAGGPAAATIGRYVKEWYGMRAAQCRALLQALVWVEHPSAVQLLFAVGRRFRTRSIQDEANKQVQALAERKGWSVSELADRTVPTAGLDDDASLVLDFGPRQFRAKLNAEAELDLFDDQNKPIKSLPDPRKEDDKDKADSAKKQLAAAKKELKALLTMQRERLYEAMCTERTWRFDDWTAYLNEHPILRLYCQRLVWAVFKDNKLTSTFRALPDGSLTDVTDEAVTIKPDEIVRVAHECQVSPEISAAWRQHLADYKVEPLFEQFGRPGLTLSQERREETEANDFEGHVVEAFRLRGRANKSGYVRGETQDGGWFYTYRKRLPTLGIEATIEFTGNMMPEENRTVALKSLYFDRVGNEAVEAGRLSLGEVPPVLLSECWNDFRSMAGEGTGFDPKWEKRISG